MQKTTPGSARRMTMSKHPSATTTRGTNPRGGSAAPSASSSKRNKQPRERQATAQVPQCFPGGPEGGGRQRGPRIAPNILGAGVGERRCSQLPYKRILLFLAQGRARLWVEGELSQHRLSDKHRNLLAFTPT